MNDELQYLSLLLDPVKFARQFIEPDPWQRDLLLSNESRIMLNCCRQSGKTTITAILALHHALHNPAAVVLILSRTSRQSGELFRKIIEFYKEMGRPIPPVQETAFTLTLANKSRIISLPGEERTVRGYGGVSLLIIDEAAQVKDELYHAVRPMLATTSGRLILLSTPWGRSGFFYKMWHEGLENWKRIEIPADQCPRISSEFLTNELAAQGEFWFNQEYKCKFQANSATYFTLQEIENAFDPNVKPLFDPETGELNVPIPDHPVKTGMIGMDWEL